MPCAIAVELFLTIRYGGVQFRHFGHAMKNTIGKIFQKQEAGEGAGRLRRRVLAVAGGPGGHGDQILRDRPGHQYRERDSKGD